MESCFLAVVLLSSFAVHSSHFGITDWDDVVVAREGTPTTLVCTDTTVSGAVTINWKVKSLVADEWKLVLSASKTDQFSSATINPTMRLTDPNFHDSGVFSLYLLPKLEDRGLYLCLINQQETKEWKILLAILTVSIVPAPPVPRLSTLRLVACVKPDCAAAKISWSAPGGISMRSHKMSISGTVAKLPQVQNSDGGVYVCTVHPWGNRSSSPFAFDVHVTVDAHKVASFTNITHGPDISTAIQAQASFLLTCPAVEGDYVLLHWRPPDISQHRNMRIVYQYDRWRGSMLSTEQSKRFQLAGPPYNADAGSFSFLFAPGIKDGGLYICNVYCNDNTFSQTTQLSVLKVETKPSPSKLELGCMYSEPVQVQSASWTYRDKSPLLPMSSKGPGSITITVSLPITHDTAGIYTCTLKLKNGQTIWATQEVNLTSDDLVNATTSSLLPSLSALLLLVPLVAVSVGVLLWRQKHISDRGIEQSLSVHSGEVENIYENPEDITQAPPQGSVYMDLKPRREDDVYKELERCEQCHN